MNSIYYSLKTKTEEHRLTPVETGYKYEVFNLQGKKINRKRTIDKEAVTKFIYDKQKELGKSFEKISPKVEVEKKKEEPKKEKVFSKKQDVESDGLQIHTNSTAFEHKDLSEFLKDEHEYKLIVSMDFRTGDVDIKTYSTPASDILLSSSQSTQLIDRLFFSLVATFPELVENHMIQASSKRLKMTYQDFHEALEKNNTIKTSIRVAIMDALKKAINSYKIV